MTNPIAFTYNQQIGAIRKNAPQEDALSVTRSATKNGEIILAILADADEGERAAEAARFVVSCIEQNLRARMEKRISGSMSDLLAEAIRLAGEKYFNRFQYAEPIPQVGVSVLAVYQNRVYLVNVGHTRAYLVRNNSVFPLSNPNNDRLGSQRPIEPDQMIRSPEKGAPSESLAWQAGDHLILCSDGLTGKDASRPNLISFEEMITSVEEQNIEQVGRRLVSYPMSKNSDDNISVIVIRNTQKRKQSALPWLVIPLVLVAAVILFWLINPGGFSPGKEPTPFPDSGSAYFEEVTGTVKRIASGSEGQPISRNSQIMAGYRVETGDGSAILRIYGARLYIGQATSITINQLASENPDEQNHVILTLHQGKALIQTEDGKRKFTIQASKAETIHRVSVEGMAILGAAASETETVFDCIEGNCNLEQPAKAIPPNYRLDVMDTRETPQPQKLTTIQINQWGDFCSCFP